MKYIIYLDEHKIEEFEGSEMEAEVRYESVKNEFLEEGVDVFDNVYLYQKTLIKSTEVKDNG